ncbi:MAG: xanthine dehydrogenase family protein [Burkholderiales bacterium]|nr:xanthine dehydrogenase family protein [Burkholderiales bacterium]
MNAPVPGLAPTTYIGQDTPRANARRLLAGRGQYVDDLRLPRELHAAFVRSPHAHARITRLDLSPARKSRGVFWCGTGADVARAVSPWVATLTHFKGMKSAPQYAVAVDRATWQGEAVAVIVAQTRAQAEDAAQLVEVEYEPLPAVTDMETALDAATPVIHPDLGDNLAFTRGVDTGGVADVFAAAHLVVEDTFRFGRHTGVCLEPRAITADYNPSENQLTVYLANQAPHMMRDIFAKHLDIPEANVRVIARDVGGSFGIKVHVYPDEMAIVGVAKLLGRPIRYSADRLESMSTDIHAREHRVRAKMGVDRDGRITAIEIDDLTGIGPYSVYPRTSAVEGNQVVNLTGAAYDFRHYVANLRVVFQNKTPTCQYRAVGHPIAMAVAEGLVDHAAQKLGIDPAEFRRRNLIADDNYPYTSASGMKFEALSHHACLDKLLALMDYPALRAEQKALRARGIHRGIGLAALIEVTNPSAAFYGVGGARISSQDGCTLRLEPTGWVTAQTGVTEQGQGTEAMIAQVVASAVGIPVEHVRVITGDTDTGPYGGGTWASRGAGIGGEAALLAGRELKANILALAGVILNRDAAGLDLRRAQIVDAATGEPVLPLAEAARIGQYRPDTLPREFQPQLSVTRQFGQRDWPFVFTNGIQASYVEVDPDTGFVKLLKHWMVEDCGTIINPLLVDEQLRGGIAQGIGAALWEEVLYDADGNLKNGTLADYLVPMAAEMPDMVLGHVETPTRSSELGAKGAGEAGTAGAPGAVMNAINDALLPFNARVTEMPFTPERLLRALGKIA